MSDQDQVSAKIYYFLFQRRGGTGVQMAEFLSLLPCGIELALSR